MAGLIKRFMHPWSRTPKMAIDRWGILVPAADLKIPPVVAEKPLFLSILQNEVNAIFYGREENPLGFFDTLGSVDTLLPRATAVDYLNNGKGMAVHEIGPGNFNFAAAFVDAVKPSIDDLVYHAHDFSDSAFTHAQERLAPYKGRIAFNKTSLSEFPHAVTDDLLYVILVEILDDTTTEFYAHYNGLECRLLVRPKMDGHLKFPTRSLAAKMLADMGDSSLATQKMAEAKTPNREYTAQEIITLMEARDWDALSKIHPNFLRYVEYDEQVLGQVPLENALGTYGKQMTGDTTEFQKAIASHFRSQLAQVEEGYVMSIPIAGLILLWELRERKTSTIHFFDYGYDHSFHRVDPFGTYNGQITAPVNFDLLRSMASWLGYDVQLETNREFIRRNTGEDTFFLPYLEQKLGGEGIPHEAIRVLAYDGLQDKVMALNPDAELTPDNILAHRVRRPDYDAFLQQLRGQGVIKRDVQHKDGSLHLAVYKGR